MQIAVMDDEFDEEGFKYWYEVKVISIFIVACIVIFISGIILFVSVGLLLRFLGIQLGRRVKPSAERAIVITGATSGIGLCLAKRFHREGFTVFATYYDNREAGYAELQQIIAKQDATGDAPIKPRLHLIHMDIRSELSIDVAAKEIELLLKQSQTDLYCVVCNAGLNTDCSFEINTLENMLRLIQTNFTGNVMLAKRFTPPIIKSKGRIVIVSSALSNIICPPMPIYVATKAAMRSFADCLNENLKRYGASCRCVCPGNLMNKSNIIFTIAKCFQESVSKLDDDERRLYEGAIEDNAQFINKRLIFRTNQIKGDPDKTAALYGVDMTGVRNNVKFTRMSCAKDWLFSFVDGGTVGSSDKKTDLDQLGFLTAFDHAICLKDPPRRCFPGNMFFQYISGPLVSEYIPPFILTILYGIFEDRFRWKV